MGLPIARYDCAIITGLIRREKLFQWREKSPFSEGIGSYVTQQFIVVVQHVQLQASATGGTEWHPGPLPAFVRLVIERVIVDYCNLDSMPKDGRGNAMSKDNAAPEAPEAAAGPFVFRPSDPAAARD